MLECLIMPQNVSGVLSVSYCTKVLCRTEGGKVTAGIIAKLTGVRHPIPSYR